MNNPAKMKKLRKFSKLLSTLPLPVPAVLFKLNIYHIENLKSSSFVLIELSIKFQ